MFQAMNHVCATPLPWFTVLPLQYENCGVAGAKFSDCRRKVLSLPPHSSATAAVQFCYRSGTVLPLQRQNFAPAVGELCHRSERTVRLYHKKTLHDENLFV